MIKESIDASQNLNQGAPKLSEGTKPGEYLIVEVGSGDNPYWIGTTEEYRERFRENPNVRYIGIDDDEWQLRYGKNLLERKDDEYDLQKTGRLHYIKAEGQRLPFADNSIAEIIFRNVMGDDENITPRKKIQMMDEAARTLKPGGILKIIEQYTPQEARKLDMEDYIATMRHGVFERIGESETAGITDEREMDRRMTTPAKGIERDAFIIRFRKKASVLDKPETT